MRLADGRVQPQTARVAAEPVRLLTGRRSGGIAHSSVMETCTQNQHSWVLLPGWHSSSACEAAGGTARLRCCMAAGIAQSRGMNADLRSEPLNGPSQLVLHSAARHPVFFTDSRLLQLPGQLLLTSLAGQVLQSRGAAVRGVRHCSSVCRLKKEQPVHGREASITARMKKRACMPPSRANRKGLNCRRNPDRHVTSLTCRLPSGNHMEGPSPCPWQPPGLSAPHLHLGPLCRR